jgi:hypothetical protein
VRWPWSRPEGPKPVAAPAPKAWESMAPMRSAMPMVQRVTDSSAFTSTLASWQQPGVVGPMEHAVDPDAPTGVVDGLVTVLGAGRPGASSSAVPAADPVLPERHRSLPTSARPRQVARIVAAEPAPVTTAAPSSVPMEAAAVPASVDMAAISSSPVDLALPDDLDLGDAGQGSTATLQATTMPGEPIQTTVTPPALPKAASGVPSVGPSRSPLAGPVQREVTPPASPTAALAPTRRLGLGAPSRDVQRSPLDEATPPASAPPEEATSGLRPSSVAPAEVRSPEAAQRDGVAGPLGPVDGLAASAEVPLPVAEPVVRSTPTLGAEPAIVADAALRHGAPDVDARPIPAAPSSMGTSASGSVGPAAPTVQRSPLAGAEPVAPTGNGGSRGASTARPVREVVGLQRIAAAAGSAGAVPLAAAPQGVASLPPLIGSVQRAAERGPSGVVVARTASDHPAPAPAAEAVSLVAPTLGRRPAIDRVDAGFAPVAPGAAPSVDVSNVPVPAISSVPRTPGVPAAASVQRAVAARPMPTPFPAAPRQAAASAAPGPTPAVDAWAGEPSTGDSEFDDYIGPGVVVSRLPDGSISMTASAAPAEDAGGGGGGAGAFGVQRLADDVPTVQRAAEAAPAEVAGPGGGAGPASAGAPPEDLDGLARRLYGPLRSELLAELRLDRERAGLGR